MGAVVVGEGTGAPGGLPGLGQGLRRKRLPARSRLFTSLQSSSRSRFALWMKLLFSRALRDR